MTKDRKVREELVDYEHFPHHQGDRPQEAAAHS